jgi:cryptochrome
VQTGRFLLQLTIITSLGVVEGAYRLVQIAWDFNAEYITAWRDSKTGYPWIDAAMMQLKREGWMHHLARHAVACFLTRGDLYQSWEHGAKVFDQLLVDSDWALNNGAYAYVCFSWPMWLINKGGAGNWLWVSASAFFYQFFRVYSPVAFAKVCCW